MKENSRKPSIRFLGFTEAWEQCKLLNIASYRNGKAHEDNISFNGEYIVVNSKFISTEGGVIKKTSKQKEPLYKGDICFVLSDVPNGRAIAKTYLIEKTGLYSLNQRIAAITPITNLDNKFLSLRMNRNQYFLDFDDGVKQTNLSVNDVLNFKSYYPKLEEQIKISHLISDFDALITLHQRKYEKLINMKRSLLEKMFPVDGEVTPKIRFKGFAEAWEQCKLEQLGVFTSNGVDKLSKENEIPVNLLNYMDVYNRLKITTNNCTELMQVTARPEQIKNNNVLAGDIYFTPTSETAEDIGHVLVIEENLPNTVYSYHLIRYRPKYNVFYLTYPNYGFDTVYLRKQMTLKAKGAQRFVISKPDFEKLEVLYPSYAEQEKIAKLLGNLDSLITLHQRKFEKLKNIKKALLEKMFV